MAISIDNPSNVIVTQVTRKNNDGKYLEPIKIGGKAENIYYQYTSGINTYWVSLQELLENYNNFLENGIFTVKTDSTDTDKNGGTPPTPANSSGRSLLWIDYNTPQNNF